MRPYLGAASASFTIDAPYGDEQCYRTLQSGTYRFEAVQSETDAQLRAQATIGTGVAQVRYGVFQAKALVVRSKSTLYHLPWTYQGRTAPGRGQPSIVRDEPRSRRS